MGETTMTTTGRDEDAVLKNLGHCVDCEKTIMALHHDGAVG
jgi:hypothetical protein